MAIKFHNKTKLGDSSATVEMRQKLALLRRKESACAPR